MNDALAMNRSLKPSERMGITAIGDRISAVLSAPLPHTCGRGNRSYRRPPLRRLGAEVSPAVSGSMPSARL
jgi:hypothetical protein